MTNKVKISSRAKIIYSNFTVIQYISKKFIRNLGFRNLRYPYYMEELKLFNPYIYWRNHK